MASPREIYGVLAGGLQATTSLQSLEQLNGYVVSYMIIISTEYKHTRHSEQPLSHTLPTSRPTQLKLATLFMPLGVGEPY